MKTVPGIFAGNVFSYCIEIGEDKRLVTYG